MLVVAVVFLFLVSLGFGQTQGRVEPYRFSIVDTAIYLATCPGPFDILYDDVALLKGKVRYDKDGNPVQEVQQFKIIAQTTYYNSTNPDKFVLRDQAGTLSSELSIWRMAPPPSISTRACYIKSCSKATARHSLRPGTRSTTSRRDSMCSTQDRTNT